MWITTKQLAARWSISMSRVRQLAKDRGVVGRKLGNTRVWTEQEATQMEPRRPGAAHHTRNMIIKQLGEEVEAIKQKASTPQQEQTD